METYRLHEKEDINRPNVQGVLDAANVDNDDVNVDEDDFEDGVLTRIISTRAITY